MRGRLTLFLLAVSGGLLLGQTELRIESTAGEPLPYATIRIGDAGGTADERGIWTLPPDALDRDSLHVTYAGYTSISTTIGRLSDGGFLLSLSPAALFQITVVGRRDERLDRVSAAVEVVDEAAIQSVQALRTTDALADLTGAYVQQSQLGGGSPILRGFEANRVLLVVDGVRMNNAIYRSGHLQNAITVDPLALERMEVIYGAGSLAYGSDALGGVIHFRTRNPDFRASTQVRSLNGEIAMLGSTAAEARSFSGRLEYGDENWAGLTLVSHLANGSLRAGGNGPADFPQFGRRNEVVRRVAGIDSVLFNAQPLRQVGTAYNQTNLLQKLRFRLVADLELSVNLQASTTSDVPRYDALTERRAGAPRWAEWYYGPQTRLLGAIQLSDRRPTRLYTRATYSISQQFIEEDRITRRFRSDLRENSLVDVHVSNIQVDLTKELRRVTLRYGIDARHDRVRSEAFHESLETTATVDPLPPPLPWRRQPA